MNSQIMYDLTANNLPRLLVPRTPFAVGGYVNGMITKYIWTTRDWLSFPNSYHVRINVTGQQGTGNCLDVENGDATPDHVADWINSRMHIADPLLVYCNRSNLNACLAERAKTAWHGKVFMWISTLDGTLIPDRAMTQFGQLRDTNGAYADVTNIISAPLVKLMASRIGK